MNIMLSVHLKISCRNVSLLCPYFITHTQGADVDSLGNEGITPLHYAAKKSNLEMIRFLLDKGADSNLADESGRTLMHCIESNENVKCLELLVELLPKVANMF